jgi:uncharacterized protein (TIGR03435 family)
VARFAGAALYGSVPAILVAMVATAQTPAGSTEVRFEVASVKPSNSTSPTVYIAAPSPGTFRADNVWLRFLVQIAWDVRNYQVVGGPGWTGTDRYDIHARADGHQNFNQMKPMLKALLEDRFGLKLHAETREMPIYALVTTRSVKLQETKEGSCTAPHPNSAESPGKLPVCGAIGMSSHTIGGTGISMAQLAVTLSSILQRTVVDETGLTGVFDIHMEWNADQSTPGFFAPGLGSAAPPVADDGASIFTVIREKLGLSLEAKKGPVTILVIDEAEKPSPN